MSRGSHRRSTRGRRPGPTHIGHRDQVSRLGVSAPRPARESAFHDLAGRVLIDLTWGRDNSIELLAGYPRITHVNIEAALKLAAVPSLSLAVVRQFIPGR